MGYGRPGGAISWLWRILDWKDESSLMSDSELQGGSPHLCRLRTDCLASMNKIELCTDTYKIYGGPANLVASTLAKLDNTPLYLTDDIGIVFGPPTDYPMRFSRGRGH
jgi:hypothetical protein